MNYEGLVTRSTQVESCKAASFPTELAEFSAMLTFVSKNKDGIKIDDSASVLGGFAAAALVVVSLMVAYYGDTETAKLTALTADLLLGASLLHYIMKRAKYIRQLDARYATVCWHLVLGTGVLFSFIATNMMLALMTLNNMS